jgi:hypothetical protein
MNTTRHDTYNLTVEIPDEDTDIADILSGWCCPDEIGGPSLRNVLPTDIPDKYYESSSEDGDDSDYCETEASSSPAPSSFGPCETPSIRSESDAREHSRVPKKVYPEYETKHVNFERQMDPEPVRMDPYNFEYYTQSEFREYYGTNSIWKMMHPKRVYKRNMVWDCVQNGHKNHLSDNLIMHIIGLSLEI